MGDRKKDDGTKPDRPAPLPSITAPKFGRAGHPAAEVSVTSPVTTPEVAPEVEQEEERTRTETQLDPSAYVAPPDKDPDELSSEFQPVSGKELDARGRLVKQAPPAPEPEPSPRAPLPPEDLPATEVAVPQMRPPKRPAARPVERVEPAAPEPPKPGAQPVAAKRREPGRWILDREGHVAKENAEVVEPGAFDPTVRRAAPAGPPLRVSRRVAIGAGAAVVLLASAAVWTLRSSQGRTEDEAAQVADAGTTEVAWLRITSKPSGAAVRINGIPVGTTPVDRESPFAPEAELEVEVTLKGHRPWKRQFPSGQSVSAHAVLKQAR